MRVISQVLGKEAVAIGKMPAGGCSRTERRLNSLWMSHLQSTINLIGTDMVKEFALKSFRPLSPDRTGGLKQTQGSQDVCPRKGERILYAPVHVRLCCKVYDRIDLFLPHQCQNRIDVADISLDEAVVGTILYVLEIGKVAGIGQFIEIDDAVIRVFPDEMPDQVRADEARSSGYEYASVFHFFSASLSRYFP